METLTEPKAAHRASATGTNGSNGTVMVQDVPLAEVVRSPFNRTVDTKTPAFAELVDSIRIHGVIQPGLARPLPAALDPERKPGTPRLELVIGEHRWLGSAKAKRPTMPLIVRQLTDVEVVELQTIENDKRQDLNPLEEAEKYQQLIDQYEKGGLKKEAAVAKLCEKLSKGKSTVYEALRLLKLPAEAKAGVKSGRLPPSHAGLIAKIDNPRVQQKLIGLIAPADPETPGIRKLESSYGIYCPERNENGLLPFRDVKEIVDEELSREKGRADWEALATKHRAKGGKVLTEEEIDEALNEYGKGKGQYLSGGDTTTDYSKGYSYQSYKTLMGRHAPPVILAHDREYKPVELFLRNETKAAIEKNGHKKINRQAASSGSRVPVAAQKKDLERKEMAARMKPVAEAGYRLLLKTAPKGRKFPWAVFLSWFSDIGAYIPDKTRKEASKSEKAALAFLATEMVKEVEHCGGPWDEYRNSWEPQFAALCQHYGVDLAKLTKELAPEPVKEEKVPQKAAKKAKVQTSGAKPKAKTKTKTGLTAAARKKLSDAMKARWAARGKAASK